MRALIVAFNSIACLVTVSQVVAQAPPGRAIEDARAQFASGDFQSCLRGTSALLSSAKRDSVERYDLLMLRGECLLRLKQRNAALPAFEAAAAVTKGRRDVARTATATATAVLVRESPDLTYKPKGRSDRSGIDVVEPATRREAMGALFEDLKARLAPEVDKALRDKALASTNKRLRDFWELYAVEFAATGDAASTAGTLQELGGHARGLIGDELERVTTRLEQLKDVATEPAWTNQGISHRGLNSNDRSSAPSRTAGASARCSGGPGRTGTSCSPTAPRRATRRRRRTTGGIDGRAATRWDQSPIPAVIVPG
jgi:hypothetical protein